MLEMEFKFLKVVSTLRVISKVNTHLSKKMKKKKKKKNV